MDTTVDRTNDLDLAWLIAAFVAGPVGWAFTEGAGYAAVKPVCAGGSPYILGLIAVCGLLGSLGGLWLASRRMAALRGLANESGGQDVDRSYFIAAIATGLNLLVSLLIVTTLASQLFSACE